MKFVHQAGDYAVVDGVTFFFKNAVEVENRTTIEKLEKDPRFKLHETPQPEIPVHFREGAARPPDACPKCGRIVKQGRFLHEKHCRGPQ